MASLERKKDTANLHAVFLEERTGLLYEFFLDVHANIHRYTTTVQRASSLEQMIRAAPQDPKRPCRVLKIHESLSDIYK